MLHQIESKILSVLSKKMPADEVAKLAGISVSSVFSFSQRLKEKNYVSLYYSEEKEVSLTPEGEWCLSEGFPEQKVHLSSLENREVSSLSEKERAIGLPWATKNSWVKVEEGKLKALCEPEKDYTLFIALKKIKEKERIDESTLSILIKRNLVTLSSKKTLFLEPTAVLPKEKEISAANVLTREMLLSSSYKNISFRSYDISSPVEIPYSAKRHILSRLMNKISRIFTDMGFEEMYGEEIQSSFWNFDALFQPQDHPARDLADTFYLKEEIPLPSDKELILKVKKVHEKYWNEPWSEEKAEKSTLRTHTTAVSAAYLYNFCQEKKPKKYFCTGRVYRNEATDFKHLAEFFQVEGIVVWEGATFCDLLGCLKEFYRRLGFEKIRFQPSYFPYTEPSLEVVVYFEKKKQWLEMGGAGIFRPEVSIPLCDRYPVLAWGLSLERPLMLLYDIEDIRTFYKNNIGWIRKQKIE